MNGELEPRMQAILVVEQLFRDWIGNIMRDAEAAGAIMDEGIIGAALERILEDLYDAHNSNVDDLIDDIFSQEDDD